MSTAFGIHVKQTLVGMDMTISDLARDLGMGTAHLSAVLRGDKKIPEEWKDRASYPRWFRVAVVQALITQYKEKLGGLQMDLHNLDAKTEGAQ